MYLQCAETVQSGPWAWPEAVARESGAFMVVRRVRSEWKDRREPIVRLGDISYTPYTLYRPTPILFMIGAQPRLTGGDFVSGSQQVNAWYSRGQLALPLGSWRKRGRQCSHAKPASA